MRARGPVRNRGPRISAVQTTSGRIHRVIATVRVARRLPGLGGRPDDHTAYASWGDEPGSGPNGRVPRPPPRTLLPGSATEHGCARRPLCDVLIVDGSFSLRRPIRRGEGRPLGSVRAVPPRDRPIPTAASTKTDTTTELTDRASSHYMLRTEQRPPNVFTATYQLLTRTRLLVLFASIREPTNSRTIVRSTRRPPSRRSIAYPMDPAPLIAGDLRDL
jgi:hypothetical protein